MCIYISIINVYTRSTFVIQITIFYVSWGSPTGEFRTYPEVTMHFVKFKLNIFCFQHKNICVFSSYHFENNILTLDQNNFLKSLKSLKLFIFSNIIFNDF